MTIIFILILIITSILFVYFKDDYDEINYTLFLQLLKSGTVDKVYLGEDAKIKLILQSGDTFITDNPRSEGFKEELLMYDVNVVESTYSGIETFIMPAMILISVGCMLYYMANNTNREAEREIKNLSEIEDFDHYPDISFKDVAGNEEAVNMLSEMIDFIKNPEKYKEFGARLPRGVLLYGPPGTGKTLLAKALAGEAGVKFYPVAGSDFVQVYAGLGASRIRSLFKKAKEAEKSVIFIDEIDCIGKKRQNAGISGSEEGDRTLNALLAEMSGFKENEGVIVLAATNRIDVLDEALLRPGRFDRQVAVELPDVNARHRILTLHGSNKPISSDVDFRKLAEDTVYFSGAKLENLLNEASMLAVKENSKEVSVEHIDKAYYKVLVGDEKIDRNSFSRADREVTAFHESGHAIMAKLLNPKVRVSKVSIIPNTRGMGGFSLSIPEDKMYQSRKDLIDNIKVALSGRAAEEIVFGKENITSGASSDLEKATEIAFLLIGSLGMDEEYGLASANVLYNKGIGNSSSLTDRINVLMERLYDETIDQLRQNKSYLYTMAHELMKRETLKEDDVDMILEDEIKITA